MTEVGVILSWAQQVLFVDRALLWCAVATKRVNALLEPYFYGIFTSRVNPTNPTKQIY